MQGISLCAIIYLTNQSGGNYSFLATIGFITHDKILINSRRIGMIIWIIRIIRKLHRTVYKQKALSCGFRQRVGIISEPPETRINTGFLPVALLADTDLILS